MSDKKPMYQVARILDLDEDWLGKTLIKHEGPIEYFGRELRADVDEVAAFLEEQDLMPEDDEDEDEDEDRAEKRRAKSRKK